MTYKTKFFGVVVATVFVLFLVFKMNISKTVNLKRQYKIQKEQLASIDDAQFRLKKLEAKLGELNKLLGSSTSPKDLREKVLESVVESSTSKKVALWELPNAFEYTEDDMQIYTNKIVLQGDFKSLLKYLYLLETKERLSRIRSVNFIHTKKRGTRYERLYLEVFLQNIEIKEE